MSQTTIFGFGALFLAMLTLYMHRMGAGAGARLWGASFLCMYASGVALAISQRFSMGRMLYPLLGTAFAALLWAGAREFAGRRIPRWFYPFAAAVGVIRGVLQLVSTDTGAQVTGAAFIVTSALAASFEIWRGRRSPPEAWLALALPVLGVVSCLHAAARIRGAPLDPWLLAWFGASLLVMLLQIASMMSRVLIRSRELLVEGERRATELHEEKARIERDRARLEALVDSVPFGLMLTNAEGRILAVNRGFPRLHPPEETPDWIGRSVADYLNALLTRLVPEDRDREVMAKLLDPLATLPERELRFLDGRTAVARVHTASAPDGTSIGRLWTLRDVGEERRTQERLRRAQQLERLGELAGGVAHDLNNQLTVMLGNAESLHVALGDDAPALADLEDVERAARHCVALTRDLLDFSRRSPRTLERIELAAFLSEWRGRQRQLPPWVLLELIVASDVPAILADATQLERVLGNLVLNARDSITSEGRIVVSAQAAVPAVGSAHLVELSVADDGVGIDSETCERIFDPFFSTKPPGEGAGLGLAIVYGIVNSHGGSVEVLSQPGKGSRFVTRWPAATAAIESAASVTPRAAARGGSECVLVAEDERAVRRFVVRALVAAGYRVLEASDGEEAIETWNVHRTDVALLLFDLSMRRCSGVEAILRIQAHAPRLPAIVMSGNLTPEAVTSLPAGVARLHKPFRAAALLDVVRAALDATERLPG